MQKSILFLLAAQCAQVLGQPYSVPPSDLASQTDDHHPTLVDRSYGEILQVLEIRHGDDSDSDKARIVVRATTATTTDSTMSTTDSTTSTISETTTSSTTSSTTTSETTTSTTTSSTTTSATTTSTTSGSTTTSTASTTTSTSTATATSTESTAMKAYNHKGNIAAIIFGVCLISLFLGISIIHCARDRAKSRRIAARELLKASAVSSEPLAHSKTNSTANLLPERSSMMFKQNPFTDSCPPQSATSPTPDNNVPANSKGHIMEHGTAGTANPHRMSLV
ncbi:hypothetical protein N7532_003013 [Penicillium argentinense]|uniref:Mid2 domain-containing protein n=1 Tax=Penicillium argentinense TaxID=1131581 RepID=A0A9W9FLR1_9EURO|nr:uncharacterized protein N7532_003013 [Penicillium argentinense]KAJ5102484.1 hypothetical protein N7532_003013 [Penicillium argentinense]